MNYNITRKNSFYFNISKIFDYNLKPSKSKLNIEFFKKLYANLDEGSIKFIKKITVFIYNFEKKFKNLLL